MNSLSSFSEQYRKACPYIFKLLNASPGGHSSEDVVVQNDCSCLAQTNWKRSIIIYNYKISFDLWAKKKNDFRIHYLIPFGLYTERHLNPYGWSTKYYSTCLLIDHSMPHPCAVPPQVRNQNWAAQR
jgi:hypothetical protein